jgi:phosphotransferase system enzyme I (PtsP)
VTDPFEIEQPKQSLLENICTVITDSRTPQHSLQAIVELIAGQYDVDVCSVYLFDAGRKQLILRATIGLNPQSIDRISMGIDEGLTGLVLETMGPVFVRQPEQHTRYKYFEHSGEEVYQTFLGIPLVFHQQTFGVLVLQTIDDQSIAEKDIAVFSTIASQIAATAAYSGLMHDLQKERMERRSDMAQASRQAPLPKPESKSKERKSILKGFPVSAGFAEGQAQYLVHGIGFDQIRIEKAANTRHEKARLQKAFKQAIQQIRDLSIQITDIPANDAAIVEAHQMLLSDNHFQARIMAQVDTGFRAESALKLAIQAYLERFSAMDDPYMRERGSDIEDLGRRVLRNLLGVSGFKGKAFEHPTIVIASDISAVDLISLRQPNLRGIVLAKGGKTSHAVILAKSFEVPMIIGLEGVFEAVRERERLIVDGNSGLLFRNPPLVIKEEYRRLRIEKDKINQQLVALRDQKATTLDGAPIHLGANIGLLSDLELVDKYGADDIGLYRTEFPFLVRKDFPSEQEQLDLYLKVIDSAGGRSVTLRTLDVGGDKFLSYLDYPREANPYLGWRSVRVSLELDDVFRTQIRAVLRASAHGSIRLLFPMISAVDELRQVLKIVEEEKQRLLDQHVDFNSELPLGVMVEVPATVKILKHLLRLVDFASIGTNDLIQYLLAVDRNNEKVARLYNPLHPAVVATIYEVIGICRASGKPVTICGEAASNAQCTYLFVGMGAQNLSMNPAAIPLIKDFIGRIHQAHAREALEQVLTMEQTEQIAAFLEKTCAGLGTVCDAPKHTIHKSLSENIR